MRKLFCLDKQRITLTDIADHVQQHTGIKLRVLPGDTEVHGVLFGNHFPAGYKVPMEYNKGKYWCNDNLGDGEHTCVILVLFERDWTTSGTVHQKAHPNIHHLHQQIPAHIDNFAKQHGLQACHHDAEALKSHLDFFVALR